ncbi:MAG: rhodanese-like domain-containing protein, partial [Thermoanaerobaculia bacterium]
MGKRHEPTPSSSKTTLIVMVIGGLLVAGLVGWALTRTVEPSAPAPVAETSAPMTTDTTPSATVADTSGAVSVPMTTEQSPATTTSLAPPVLGDLHPEVATAHSQTPEKAAVPRLAVEDLRAKVNRNAVVVIDVRDQSSFERGHIPGAMHIPLASIEANLSQIPKDKPI